LQREEDEKEGIFLTRLRAEKRRRGLRLILKGRREVEKTPEARGSEREEEERPFPVRMIPDEEGKLGGKKKGTKETEGHLNVEGGRS